ncbi:unnamed protein product [Cyprideis torosa]|uniref:Uncharacterized protein n=1 Tax=Cyprideis torosa TaxID=163714 RepID=A0A7R8ZT91_9CRUS|nr:unnamed protein product [Cyprideis torosa]CAG0897665.1 unnamed protein product [Cyprideis torosa]
MSRTSKVVLLIAAGTSLGIVAFVHYKQAEDRHRLKQGIVRDIERQEKKKRENLERLREQEVITKIYRELEAKEEAERALQGEQ